MKKSMKIVAVFVVAVMLCLTLASCGKKLSGAYTNAVLGTGATYEFKGNDVTVSVKLAGMDLGSVDGTYSIDDDKITIEFESDKDEVKKYAGTFDFEELDNGNIKIGVLEYKPVD